MGVDAAQAIERNDAKMKRTLDFRQPEAAAERVIAIGHSMKDKHLALEEAVQRLEHDKAWADSQLTTLANFLLINFPDDLVPGDPTHGEDATEMAMRLLRELKKLRLLVPPQESE